MVLNSFSSTKVVVNSYLVLVHQIPISSVPYSSSIWYYYSTILLFILNSNMDFGSSTKKGNYQNPPAGPLVIPGGGAEVRRGFVYWVLKHDTGHWQGEQTFETQPWRHGQLDNCSPYPAYDPNHVRLVNLRFITFRNFPHIKYAGLFGTVVCNVCTKIEGSIWKIHTAGLLTSLLGSTESRSPASGPWESSRTSSSSPRPGLAGERIWLNYKTLHNWEDRFYTPPPPGSDFWDCKCARMETTTSAHHPLWVVVVYRIGFANDAFELQRCS